MRGVAVFSKKREWLKYGLRRVRVATGELAFCVAVCVQWHESQGRCPKLQKKIHICKFSNNIFKMTYDIKCKLSTTSFLSPWKGRLGKVAPPLPLPSPLALRYHSDVSLQDIAIFLGSSQRATKKRTLFRASSFISYLSFT